MTLYDQLIQDLRDYSVFVPPPGVPTKSVVREHGDGCVSFRLFETDVPWTILSVRSENVILRTSASGEADIERKLALLRKIGPDWIGGVSDTAPLAVHSMPLREDDPRDCLALVHPSVERGGLIPKAAYAIPFIYGVRHCYRCEFTDDDRPEEATYRIRRVLSGVSPTPRPAIQMRFAVTATGVKSTGGKKLGIFEFSMVMRMLADVKSGGGFAEIENWQRHRVNLTCEKGVWQITENKRSWEPFENEVEPWLHAFAFDSYEAAMKLIKR